jgi:small membrane protein
MIPLQPVLLLLMLGIAVLYCRTLTSRGASGLVALILMGLGLVCIIYPGLTNRAARLFGVGRGADLLMYVSVLASGYAFLVLYVKARALEHKITELTREMAINSAAAPPANTHSALRASRARFGRKDANA